MKSARVAGIISSDNGCRHHNLESCFISIQYTLIFKYVSHEECFLRMYVLLNFELPPVTHANLSHFSPVFFLYKKWEKK